MGPFFVFVLILLTSYQTNQEETLSLRVCNCTKPIIRGVIDLNKPAFCEAHPGQIKKEIVQYKVSTRRKSWTWKGFACAHWQAQKENQ